MSSILTISSAGYNLWGDVIGVTSGKGTIELENGWQMIACNIKYGFYDKNLHRLVHDNVTIARIKNYIIDQIDDLYGEGMIEVANTYTGDNNFFYSYIPGITPNNSPNNFYLSYDDNGSIEITGFWIKSLNSSTMTISWGE
jgi:hypothetical protein